MVKHASKFSPLQLVEPRERLPSDSRFRGSAKRSVSVDRARRTGKREVVRRGAAIALGYALTAIAYARAARGVATGLPG
jgi:hypothetical protein